MTEKADHIYGFPLRSTGSVEELVEQPARPHDLRVGGSDAFGQCTIGRDDENVTIGLDDCAIVSSPSPGACTTSTPSTITSSAPAGARALEHDGHRRVQHCRLRAIP
jgi:hypothetical protein